MTRERFIQLLDLVDEVNKKVYVDASLEHGLYDDRIFVALYYQGDKYVTFSTFAWSDEYDEELVKGEAFLKGLLAEAEANPKARRSE